MARVERSRRDPGRDAEERIDPRQLRTCMGHFATGVSVVTCQAGEQLHGFTVNSFTSVSMDPPLVLVSVQRRAKACELLARNPFTINVLTAEQADVGWHFAGRSRDAAHIHWDGRAVVPRLAGCLAWIECDPWQAHDGGDHVLQLGRVQDFEFFSGAPLLFYLGKFREIGHELDEAPWLTLFDCHPNPGWFGNAARLY